MNSRQEMLQRMKAHSVNIALANRFDADDDNDGHWVTTEQGNHMFINGEGEPTKGNPYVLAAAKGEGSPKSKSGDKKSTGNSKIFLPEVSNVISKKGATEQGLEKQQIKVREKAEKDMEKYEDKSYPGKPYLGAKGVISDGEDNHYFVSDTGTGGTQYISAGTVDGVKIGSIVRVGKDKQNAGRIGVVTSAKKSNGETSFQVRDENGEMVSYGYHSDFPAKMISEENSVASGSGDKQGSYSHQANNNATSSEKYKAGHDKDASTQFSKLAMEGKTEEAKEFIKDFPEGTVIETETVYLRKNERGTWSSSQDGKKWDDDPGSTFSDSTVVNIADTGHSDIVFPDEKSASGTGSKRLGRSALNDMPVGSKVKMADGTVLTKTFDHELPWKKEGSSDKYSSEYLANYGRTGVTPVEEAKEEKKGKTISAHGGDNYKITVGDHVSSLLDKPSNEVTMSDTRKAIAEFKEEFQKAVEAAKKFKKIGTYEASFGASDIRDTFQEYQKAFRKKMADIERNADTSTMQGRVAQKDAKSWLWDNGGCDTEKIYTQGLGDWTKM